MTTADRREALDALLVALWQCETEGGFEHVAAKVHAHLDAALAAPEGEREVRVTLDTLDQWTEDALTQGISPATYVYATLSAELDGDE